MKVVIIGKGLMLANLIIGAIDAGCKIVGVLRYETTVTDRIRLFLHDLFNPSYDYTLMKQFNLKDLKFKSVNSDDFRKFLIRKNVDILFVGTWKERITKETFNIPTIGTVNAHPSLLPAYRGPNPYLQAILNGETHSGVTLHLVDENYDTGAILYQEKIPINPEDTSKELRERTVIIARSLITKFLNNLNNGITTPIPQIEEKSTYFSNITGHEKMLDFDTQTSIEIYRTVKALHPFLPCYITYKKNFFIVNPYKIEILNKEYSDNSAGDIIDKSPAEKSLTIVCKDKRAVKFTDLKLYGLNYLTKLYIEFIVKG